ncbi:hypothetical protein LY90DRAFT_703040 [Neocallimastix californiae]|uniref:EF-hand domain-containing protein n=1 Tax=Neocallimastix californiae TaxID=1754190 RepID=A0A1Y2CRV8_9FUNG|nr:hypothetical protein LY90DRAFT_703040 [Neocallimastix californiae]|eukprot:ORY49713.1 hypothetical protein LY90DRAFT_703040 [Neocallimastix californiae]
MVSNVTIANEPVAVSVNLEKNVDIIFLKIREQLQTIGGRSVLKLYTMLNLERLIRETASDKNSEHIMCDPNEVIDENSVANITNNNNNSSSTTNNYNSNSNNNNNNNNNNNSNNVILSLEASRTANSSFVGVVSSCASSLGIPQSKSNSVTSRIFNNDLLQDPPVQPRRGSMVTSQSKNNNDLNSFVKHNERRYSRPRTNSLCIDSTIHKNSKIMFPSTNIQNIDNSKSIEIFPLNDKEHRTSKTNDGSAMTSNFSASSTSPMKDIYNDNISVTYEELVDGCTRVGLSLTTQEYETIFKNSKNKNSMVGIHRFILRIGGGLSVKRLEIVQNTFRMLINNNITTPNNAFILLKDAKAKFSPNEHPRVKSGELTPEQVLYHFLLFFESDRPDGVIELIEWEYYYALISSEISQDSFFEKQMVQCWPGLQLYSKYNITPKLNSKRRREIAEQLNIMNYITNNFRVFRDLLDIALVECNQDGSHHLEKNEVYEILRHFYLLIHQPFDESIFDELWIRIYRELEEVETISDYEEQFYNAIKKEIVYMEYEIFVHVTDEEN